MKPWIGIGIGSGTVTLMNIRRELNWKIGYQSSLKCFHFTDLDCK